MWRYLRGWYDRADVESRGHVSDKTLSLCVCVYVLVFVRLTVQNLSAGSWGQTLEYNINKITFLSNIMV